jgi:carboxymethylenebutenolidase
MRPSLLAAAVLCAGCGGSTPAVDWTGGLSEQEFIRLHELRPDDAPPPRGETVPLGYLSLPPGGGPAPGLIVIHEWWGLNDHIRHFADRLAAEGYAALAVDLYGGEVATDPERAMALMRAVDEAGARGRLVEAHRFLSEDPRVRAPRTGVIGWCFGGAMALQAALAIPELDAAVMYYGRVVDDPEALRAVRAPLLGLFANRDRSITRAHVDSFERALGEAGVDHRIVRYDADHAFANPSGPRYDRAAAEEAWDEARRFLAARLRP